MRVAEPNRHSSPDSGLIVHQRRYLVSRPKPRCPQIIAMGTKRLQRHNTRLPFCMSSPSPQIPKTPLFSFMPPLFSWAEQRDGNLGWPGPALPSWWPASFMSHHEFVKQRLQHILQRGKLRPRKDKEEPSGQVEWRLWRSGALSLVSSTQGFGQHTALLITCPSPVFQNSLGL